MSSQISNKGIVQVLPERDQKILSVAQLQGHLSQKEIARAAGYSLSQVRSTLSRLQKKGIIRPYTLINVFPLGFLKVALYIALRLGDENKALQVINYLCQCDPIVSVVELSGDFQLFVSTAPRTIPEFADLLDKLSGEIDASVFEKVISIRRSLILYQRKYLSGHSLSKLEFLSYGLMNARIALDMQKEDIAQILEEIKNNGHPNCREIADATGIPHSTVHVRIKQLEESGIIVGYPWSVDPTKLGLFAFDLLVNVQGVGSSLHESLHRYCLANNLIVGFTQCMGAWDYEIRIEAPSASDANCIIRELYSSFPEISRIRMVSIGKEYKYMKAPSISLGDS